MHSRPLQIVSCLLITVIITIISSPSSVWSNPIHTSNSCHRVQKFYQEHTTSVDTAKVKKNYACPTTSSSCCRDLQSAIVKKAQYDFFNDISSTTQVNVFVDRFKLLDSQMRLKLHMSLEKQFTLEKFSHTRLVSLAHKNLIRFIQTVTNGQYLYNSNNSLIDYIEKLFDAIVLTELQRSHGDAYPEAYVSCVLNLFREDESIVSIRQRMIQFLEHYVEFSRLLLRSLELTSSTISKLSSLELSEQCVQQLTGNFHCFRCSHHELDWKPCASLCHRTIDTCVGSSVLATLDDTWATLTSVFEKLTKTIEDFHMDSIFNTYHELISNAKQSLESNNPHISKKIRLACGIPKRYSRSVSMISTFDYSNSQEDNHFQDLHSTVGLLYRLFDEYKSMFSNLPDKLCQKHQNIQCWNGKSFVSSYSTHASQPSVEIAKTNDLENFIEEIKRLKETLRQFQSNRSLHLLDDDMQKSSSFLNEASGSGQGPDDEDCQNCEEGSGNGVINETIETSSVSNNEDIIINIHNDDIEVVKVDDNKILQTDEDYSGTSTTMAHNPLLLSVLLASVLLIFIR